MCLGDNRCLAFLAILFVVNHNPILRFILPVSLRRIGIKSYEIPFLALCMQDGQPGLALWSEAPNIVHTFLAEPFYSLQTAVIVMRGFSGQ